MLIAIDTSTDTAGLALVGDDELIAEFTWRCGQNHSVQLLPNLAFMLSQAKLSLTSASGIIVAKGPGGYNGLRVGLSTAKALAFCLKVPIAGVSTLEAMAYEHAALGIPVCTAVSPGGGEIAAAIFEMKDGKWSRVLSEQMTTVENLCSQISERTAFCGQIPPQIVSLIRQNLGERAVILPRGADWRRAGFLAELGRFRFSNNDFDDPASLQPLYLRGPQITPPKHK